MWVDATTGAGTITFYENPDNGDSLGDIVELENTVLGDEAYIELTTDISAGEILELEVMAYNDDSSQDEALLRFESPLDVDLGLARANEDTVRSTDWSTYRLKYQAPFGEGFKRYPITIQLGFSNTRVGKARFYRPKVKKYGGTMGQRQVIMDGVVRIASGNSAGQYELLDSYQTTNVNTITYQSSTSEIQIAPVNRGSTTIEALPQITQVRASGSEPIYLWRARVVNQGTIAVSAFTTSGSVVNLSTITTEVRLKFSVEL